MDVKGRENGTISSSHSLTSSALKNQNEWPKSLGLNGNLINLIRNFVNFAFSGHIDFLVSIYCNQCILPFLILTGFFLLNYTNANSLAR
jgi:hypothetical protein